MPTAKHVVKERTNPDPKDPLLAIEKKTKHANLLEQQRIEHQNLGRRYKKEIEELKAKHEQETREFVVACKEERSAKGSTEPRGNCGSQVEKNDVPREADDKSTCCQCRVTRKCSDCQWTSQCDIYGSEHGFFDICAEEATFCDFCSGCITCQGGDGCCKWNRPISTSILLTNSR